MGIKDKLVKLYHMRSSGSYLTYLRTKGMNIGEGVNIWAKPFEVVFDITRPWLINIGNNVQITKGVTILTHGYDWSTMKSVYGDICGSSGRVVIGDNCFIGMNATILKGSIIGDNVIVGSGSVLTGKTYPSNCVIAGNPAKVICTLEEYHNKRLKAQINEAKELVVEYYKSYGKIPAKSVLSEFFFLFEKRCQLTESSFISQMKNMNNYEESLNVFMNTEPEFNGYEEFIAFCLDEEK